ncbi:hypothetical protein [Streptomyces sp. NPDC085529]|uniref:hypothetical protein n=1 Tax=Streptomyces sp. NPDC085529 TaxID=3365729 RepID=UPI0037D48377
MTSSYDHLLAAEELLQKAHGLLRSGKRRRAEPLIRLASGFLEAAAVRDRLTADPLPYPMSEPPVEAVVVPTARPPAPPWCGQCDGPEISLRWISMPRDDQGRSRAAKCPRCHPGSAVLKKADSTELPKSAVWE